MKYYRQGIRWVAGVVAGVVLLSGQAQGTEQVPVISLSEVVDYRKNACPDDALGLRPQIITRLVRDYECVVLCRANPAVLDTESTLARLKAVSESTAPDRGIWAADYAVRINLKALSRSGRLTVYAVMKDIRENVDKEPEKLNIEVDRFDQVADELTSRLAEKLGLRKRKEGAGGTPRGQETWAILPFAMHTASKGWSQPYEEQLILATKFTPPPVEYESYVEQSEWCATNKMHNKEFRDSWSVKWAAFKKLRDSKPPTGFQEDDGGVSTSIEAALQSLSPGVRLVERKSLESVLNEVKLRSMTGATEDFGGWLGGLVGADRIVMGYVVEREKGRFLVMLHLVDVRTSMIIAVQEVMCEAEQEIPERSAKAAVQMVGSGVACPAGRMSAAWQRRREADFYLVDERLVGKAKAVTEYDVSIRNRVRVAYLLMSDNVEYLMEKVCPALKKSAELSWWDSKTVGGDLGAVKLYDYIMRRYGNAVSYEWGVLDRIEMLIDHCDYETALQRIREYERESRYADVRRVRMLEAKAELGLGNGQRALTLAKQALPGTDALYVILKIARAEGVEDRELEYDTLKKLDASILDGGLSVGWDILRLKLKYEGPEAAIKYWESRTLQQWERQGEIGAKPRHALATECYIRLGKYEEARKLCGPLVEKVEWAKQQWERLNELTGKDEKSLAVPQRTPVEIMPFPEKYKIYCYPLGKCNMSAVSNICSKVGKWIGTKIVIQNPVAMPEGAFDAETECHHLPSVSSRLFASCNIPDDAVFVFFLTEERVAARVSGDWSVKSPVFPWRGNPFVAMISPDEPLSDVWYQIQLSTAYALAYPLPEDWLGWSRREYAKCSSQGRCRGGKICGLCQKTYSVKNFDACHRALHAFLKREGARLSAAPYAAWDYYAKKATLEAIRDGVSQRPYAWETIDTHAIEARIKANIQSVKDKAEKGDPWAQTELSWWYSTGLDGLRRNYAEAFKWAQKAADQHYPPGEFQMALRYLRAQGVPGDLAKGQLLAKAALPALLSLAEKGDAQAQWSMGEACVSGAGVQSNPDKGAEWYRKAAEQDYPKGIFYYGRVLKSGKGVGVDPAQSFQMFKKAADMGCVRGWTEQAWLFFDGQGVEKDFQKALECLYIAAKFENYEAQNGLGWAFMNHSKGVLPDLKEAERWFRMAVSNGDDRAIANMGWIYDSLDKSKP